MSSSSSYCWRFRIDCTYNKHLPADLKEHANIVIWRVMDLSVGTYCLVGFVQFIKPRFLDQVQALGLPDAHFSCSDITDYHLNFNPLEGGYVISWGTIVHIHPNPPIRLKKRKSSGPRSVKQLAHAAHSPDQTRISLSKLAASEMGVSPPPSPPPSLRASALRKSTASLVSSS